jgi:hypothetical protein
VSRRASAVLPSWGWPEFLCFFRKELGPLSPLEKGYVPWLIASPDFETAVDRAVRSRFPDGKMHNHQTRVRLSALLTFGENIIRDEEEIRLHTSFHTFWCLLDRIKPWGIGPLTVYDVAERLGRYLRLAPERVYLHAGPTLGAKALGIDVAGKAWLEMGDLPEPMRILSADEAEDFLCVFNSYLHRFRP